MPGLGERIGRWFRQADIGLKLGIRLGAAYIWVVNVTTRWEKQGSLEDYHCLAEDTGVLALIWHGRLFMTPVWAPSHIRSVAMISANRDGDLISGIVGRWGVKAARGSSYDHAKKRDKGGVRAYIQARRELKKGGVVVAISPDGPRGPRMRIQAGAAQIAIETQKPTILMTYSARWAITLNSWDRFLVPLPFGRGAQIFSEPIAPPKETDENTVQAFGKLLEARLTEMTLAADKACGRTPIEPAEPIDGS